MNTDFAKLHRAINPKCIVVVGDKGRWVKTLNSFKGKLLSVQISPDGIKAIEALGVKNYTSLLDIPDQVDLVIVTTSRGASPKVLDDCITRGDVGGAHFFTAGFGETGTEEGKNLEKIIVEKAKNANFNLIGPNCMGVYNPGLGVRFLPHLHTDISGSVGMISQSGVELETFSLQAFLEGVPINKSVSFGNGIVLDSTDFLEYFGNDPEIKVIAMYIEGVKDGKRFLKVLREVTAKKPVVIWKGGRTDEGGRATASHSGSMAIPHKIWDSATKQAGAVSATSLEDLIDTLKAFVYLPPVTGDRMGLLAGSGGLAVAITDAFSEAGLKIPRLSQKSYDDFATFFSVVGGSYRNPVDIGGNQGEQVRIMKILEQDPNIDNLILLQWVGAPPISSERFKTMIPALIDIKNHTTKPMMVIVSYLVGDEYFHLAKEITDELQKGGVPTFATAEHGARALKKALDYYTARSAAAVTV